MKRGAHPKEVDANNEGQPRHIEPILAELI
jgi:hypothetical protein